MDRFLALRTSLAEAPGEEPAAPQDGTQSFHDPRGSAQRCGDGDRDTVVLHPVSQAPLDPSELHTVPVPVGPAFLRGVDRDYTVKNKTRRGGAK